MVLQLAARVESDPKEPRKLSFAFLPSPLDDVCGDRHRSPDDLTAKRDVVGATNSYRDPMGMQRESMRLLPNMKLFEIAHAPSYLGMDCVLPSVPHRGGSFPPESLFLPRTVAARTALSQAAAKLFAPCLSIVDAR